MNQKTGSFRSQTIPEANGPYGIVCLDIDGDGRFDLAWGNDGKTGAVDHRLSYVLNRGSGTSGEIIFTPAAHISIGFNPSDMSVADFDKSGTPDIAVAVTDNDQVAILYNVFDKNTSTVKFDQVRIFAQFVLIFFNFFFQIRLLFKLELLRTMFQLQILIKTDCRILL